MSRAIAGAPYVIKPGDNLSAIANQAYGDPRKWRDIWKANQFVLRSGDPNLIFPGEVINIPPSIEIKEAISDILSEQLPSIAGKAKDDFTIIVNNTEIPIAAGRAIRTMDTCADTWTATIPWDTELKKITEALLPFRYYVAKCYLGGKQIIEGCLYNIRNRVSKDGITKDLEGFSYTADIIDSTISPPYEANNITLRQRAKDLVEPLGIVVKFDPQLIAKDLPFKRISANATDTIFDHLVELAAQRGILISSTPLGELHFTQSTLNRRPVATIEEGKPPFETAEIVFDGRKRFNTYRLIGQSPLKNNKRGLAKDPVVPRSRSLTVSASDLELGEYEKAAIWRRNKTIAECLEIKLPVNSWYTPSGSMWRENTYVTVKSKSLHIPDGFNFLIRSVEYTFEPAGISAILDLVPPQLYDGSINLIEPWGVSETAFFESIIDEITG